MIDERARPSAELGRLLADRWLRRATAAPTGNGPPAAAALSETQAAQWLFEQLNPGTAVNNLACRLLLRGPVDEALLVDALEQVAERHRLNVVLSTVDEMMLVAAPVHQLLGPVVDVRPAGADAAVLAATAAAQPFNLNEGPLVRSTVYRIDDRTVLLLLVGHHLVVDGASLAVLLADLGMVYAALAIGRTPDPPPRTEPETVDPARLEADRAYWRQQLSGSTPLALPVDRPAPQRRSFRTGFCAVELDHRLTAAVRRLAVETRTTAFTVIAAAFQAWLGRLCDQRDVVTATPVSTRGPQERSVGTRVNLAAIRSIVDGAVPFRAFVGSVHDTLVQALAHCSVAADSVAHARPAGHSLFSTLLTLQRRPAPAQLGPLTVELLEAGPVAIQRHLELYLWQDPTIDATIDGRLGYDAQLFDPTTAAGLAAQFITMLHAAATGPDKRIADLAAAAR
jgi:hypothetical protein